MDRSTLGLRLVADAIPTIYSRHDKAVRLSKLIGTIVGDRNSIVSTPTGKGLGQLVPSAGGTHHPSYFHAHTPYLQTREANLSQSYQLQNIIQLIDFKTVKWA